MDYSALLGQIAPTTVQQAQGQNLAQQQAQGQISMQPYQQALMGAQAQSAQQDLANNRRALGISMLAPILNEPDPAKQQALMKSLVPVYNRYVPDLQLDPDTADVSTIRALAQSQIPPEKMAEMQQQRMMAMGGLGGSQGSGIFPNNAPGLSSLISQPTMPAPSQDASGAAQQTPAPGNAPGNTPMPQTVTATPGVDTNFLNQAKMINPLAATMAENMIAGTFSPESGKGENDPVYVAALSIARRADPTFNAQSMIGRPAMVKNASSGDMYKLETSLNTGMAHLYDLHALAPLTGNANNSGTIPNWIGKHETEALGGPEAGNISRYESTLNSAAPEIAKYLGGGAATDTGTAEAKGNFGPLLAPNYIQKNAVDMGAKMMAKGGSLQHEYNTTMGGAANHQVVNPMTEALYADMQGKDLTPQQQMLVNSHRAESNLPPKTWANQDAVKQAQGQLKAPPGGTPIVTTQKAFDALPSGALYVEGDGKTYRKP